VSLSALMHVVPEQHPLQLFGPHGAATHDFAFGSHCSPDCVQSTHLFPDDPHASDDTPDTHASCPSKSVQQPEGQLVTSHVGCSVTHAFTCGSQNSKPSATQSLQVVPPNPHALRSLPARQVPVPSQHPCGHVAGPHAPPSGFGPSTAPSLP
jgi:hypothetical protein